MNTSIDPQEKVAGALGAFLFFIPFLMGKVTDFTLFYMRQGFLLLILGIIVWIIGMVAPFLGIIITLANIVLFCSVVFLAWKAWQGERFALPYVYDSSLTLIKALGLENVFSPKNNI
jgi:uncharacterized membrane protein